MLKTKKIKMKVDTVATVRLICEQHYVRVFDHLPISRSNLSIKLKLLLKWGQARIIVKFYL